MLSFPYFFRLFFSLASQKMSSSVFFLFFVLSIFNLVDG